MNCEVHMSTSLPLFSLTVGEEGMVCMLLLWNREIGDAVVNLNGWC